MRKFILAIVIADGWAGSAVAIGRTDVLECGVSDGSKFILRSKYEFSLIPLPAIHSSRETNRGSWGTTYQDRAGKSTSIHSSVMFAGRRQVMQACAYFGMKNGVPLAPFMYHRADGSWSSQDSFDKRLYINQFHLSESSPAQRQMAAEGLTGAAFEFNWIYSEGDRVTYEQPLYRGSTHPTMPIDAVYQAFSNDGGKTWSEGKITKDARIFELGKSWVDQSISAKPLSLNGKAVTAQVEQ